MEIAPIYDVGGSLPVSLEAFRNRPCALPFGHPAYVPPSPQEVAGFLDAAKPELAPAVDAVARKLMADERFGERWDHARMEQRFRLLREFVSMLVDEDEREMRRFVRELNQVYSRARPRAPKARRRA